MNVSEILKRYKSCAELAAVIDQTLLAATATEAELAAFCKEAAQAGFAAVCVNPVYVPLAAQALAESPVRVCTVIDFPLGAGGIESKKAQAEAALKAGASELDFVAGLGLIKAGDWPRLKNELEEINGFAKDFSQELWGKSSCAKSREGLKSAVTKLIIETCLLTDEEIERASRAAADAGFDFVKTSTGFAIVKDAGGVLMPNGATAHAVSIMKKAAVGADVKASGGIRSLSEAAEMLEAGAARIGTSSGLKILRELNELINAI